MTEKGFCSNQFSRFENQNISWLFSQNSEKTEDVAALRILRRHKPKIALVATALRNYLHTYISYSVVVVVAVVIAAAVATTTTTASNADVVVVTERYLHTYQFFRRSYLV